MCGVWFRLVFFRLCALFVFVFFGGVLKAQVEGAAGAGGLGWLPAKPFRPCRGRSPLWPDAPQRPLQTIRAAAALQAAGSCDGLLTTSATFKRARATYTGIFRACVSSRRETMPTPRADCAPRAVCAEGSRGNRGLWPVGNSPPRRSRPIISVRWLLRASHCRRRPIRGCPAKGVA